MLTGGTSIAIAVLCTTVQHSVTQISHSDVSISANLRQLTLWGRESASQHCLRSAVSLFLLCILDRQVITVNLKQLRRIGGGNVFDRAELSFNCSCSNIGLVYRATRCFKLFLDLIQHAAEFSELHLHARQHLPDLTRPLLDCQRPKSHSQTVEDRRQCRRSGNNDPVLVLQLFDQSSLA